MSKSSDSALPTSGRLAGIDYGTVRIGIAVSDRDQTIASPLENYTRRSDALDKQFFQRLFVDERIVGLVVGLPVHLSGDESQKSVESRVFGKWLAEISELPVCYFDERFTSAQAEELLQQSGLTKAKRKKRLDKLAAQIMLSAYLESTARQQRPQSIDDYT